MHEITVYYSILGRNLRFFFKIAGKYTLGPTPLLAVKKGYCNIPYDVAFVFSEVNGDIIQWEPAPNGGWKKGNVETNRYGHYVIVIPWLV